MNGFKLHGITHTSPSQINMYATDPSAWVLAYLLGRRQPGNAAMFRGIAVEKGVVNVLRYGLTIDAAIEDAVKVFNVKTALGNDPKRDAERAHIAPMIRLAVEVLAPLGKPDFPENDAQHKIALTARGDGWELPVIGYLDLVYDDQIVDLKTTLRMPAVMSREHRRQRCIYQRAIGNRPVRFLYVTPKKAEWRADGDTAEVLAECKGILTRMERFLSLSDDKHVLANVVPVIPGSYHWNSDQAAAARLETFGL